MLDCGRLELDLDVVLGEQRRGRRRTARAATEPVVVNLRAVVELAGDVAVVVVPLDALDVVVLHLRQELASS